MYSLTVKGRALERLSIKFNKFLSGTKIKALAARNVSALYITGDKARENYVTLQPYTDFKWAFENIQLMEHSIAKRKMQIDLKQVQIMFEKYKKYVFEIEKLEEERDSIAKQLKDMNKSKNTDDLLVNSLKDKGKLLRNQLKSLKTELYPVEDEFMQSFLHLPNLLHRQCPDGEFERVLYRSQPTEQVESSKSHLDYKDLIYFVNNSQYYMMDELSEFDVFGTDALRKYFQQKLDFIPTCNPDFVRCVLLEANATPMEHYHKVMEEHLQNKLNVAYLTGGGSFESFLGCVTKLCVYPSVLPLKYVSNGRLYEKTLGDGKPSLYTATQTNAIQTFVATADLQQSEEQMDNILNVCVDFYKSFTKLNFRIIYVKAADLTPSESLRAQIEVYSPHEKRYVTVGRVSNYTDYVSKRILFTMREQKDYKFLHMVGGPVLYTSRLIAALLECGEPLDYRKLLTTLKLKSTSPNESSNSTPIDDFKSLFK